MTIKFGTSGWRGIIAKDFTFPYLRICTQAIAEEVFRNREHNKPIVVGYDTRFLSENFALEAGKILANNGLEVRFSNRDVPTPTVAFEIIRSGAAGGLNITASHNPWTYNGLKYSSGWGGPALKEMTQSIENSCEVLEENPAGIKTASKDPHLMDQLIQHLDFKTPYVKHIKSLIDAKAFRGRKLKVVVDVMHGTARGYLAELLQDLGCQVELIHEERDVYFAPGGSPDPSSVGLKDLVERVKKTKANLGLATDGDADRFGVVDADGTITTANDILALLTRYLHQSRGWTGIVAKSVMTTHAIDAAARKYGLEVKETPVGFKYIGEIMRQSESIYPSQEGEFVMGAEESGGFSIRGHVPEKDGILACLLVAEMVASSKKTIKSLLDSFHEEVGVFINRRINIQSTPNLVSTLKEQFEHKPPTHIDGLAVHRIVDLDGIKFIFHGGSWLGVRFSGTEPIIRLYLEGNSTKQLEILEKAGRSLLASAASTKAKTKKHLSLI
ncbi:hypothetical protein BVX98_07110 [bacterium F11]|nr:hypothetical protein BVX98_07110 [bacterium F11]